MSQVFLKGRQWESLTLAPAGRICWWSRRCTLVFFLGANCYNQFVHARYVFTDHSKSTIVLVSLAFVQVIKQIKEYMFIIWPKLQEKVQVVHNLHSFPDTFGPCRPKGLAPRAHNSILWATLAHALCLQGRGIFQWQGLCQKTTGFLVNLPPALIWQSQGWLDF